METELNCLLFGLPVCESIQISSGSPGKMQRCMLLAQEKELEMMRKKMLLLVNRGSRGGDISWADQKKMVPVGNGGGKENNQRAITVNFRCTM